jgi:hypothetical protein
VAGRVGDGRPARVRAGRCQESVPIIDADPGPLPAACRSRMRAGPHADRFCPPVGGFFNRPTSCDVP